ncbi:MAG TPA: hypothetical protein VF756_26105 [Thermoanaerobaculia bacterium]
MADFADLISALPLYQELDHAARRDGIAATDVAALKGLVTDIAEEAGPVLARIPLIFRQYTVHDIHHSRNVIARMGDILPKATRESLNALEITFLLLAALLHDVGMEVTDREKAETLASESFRLGHAEQNKAIADARAAGNELRAQAIQEAMLADHYRRLHAKRARLFMERHLNGRLRFREVDFTADLALLCESHAWGVEESNDASHPENAVSRLDDNVRLYGVRVNLQYLACILRLGDILDFDRSRTPLAVFQHLDFSAPKSWEEWNKHLQVKGYEITPTQVAFEIPCEHPVFYVAVHEFLGWIDDELRQCRYLIENKPRATAERYRLHLPQVVDRHKVRMADPSFVAGAFRFQLEYENILTLLMDKSLYPDPSLFLRELLQNALDACRRKEADREVKHLEYPYTPKIVVWDHSDDPEDPRVIFQDNGIGMSQRIVEHYFLRVGRSYYRSPEFDAERQRLREQGKELDACSQFGIGILSCFLVGDRFEVETFQEGHDPLHILIEGPTKYFVMRKLLRPDSNLLYRKVSSDEEDGPPAKTGTRVTVHFRAGAEVDVWSTLNTFAVNVDYPITIYSTEWGGRTVEALRWEKPICVQDCFFHVGIHRQKLPQLEGVLVASVIPFSRWDFTRHIRGSSWFWLLRGPDGQPTPRSGFLKVGSQLGFAGIASFVERIDSFNEEEIRENREALSYAELVEMLERGDVELPIVEDLLEPWIAFTDEDRNRVVEVLTRRGRALGRSRQLQSWASRPDDIEAFLTGSIDWADQPLELEPIESSKMYDLRRTWMSDQYSFPFKPQDPEDLIALHSILLPAGIVEWSPLNATSTRLGLLPFFGGVRVDVRGEQAPRPAAHRLFVPREEIGTFRQQFLYAALLHGADLVGQHGRSRIWRSWFSELVGAALQIGLEKTTFARAFGQIVEDACGLAVKVNEEVVAYLSRAEILERSSGPILFGFDSGLSEGLFREDPVNQLLSALPYDELYDADRRPKKVEVDLSSLPIVKAKT